MRTIKTYSNGRPFIMRLPSTTCLSAVICSPLITGSADTQGKRDHPLALSLFLRSSTHPRGIGDSRWTSQCSAPSDLACKFCQLVCTDIAEHRNNLPSRRAGRTMLTSINAPAAFVTVFTRNSQPSRRSSKNNQCAFLSENRNED